MTEDVRLCSCGHTRENHCEVHEPRVDADGHVRTELVRRACTAMGCDCSRYDERHVLRATG